jgi:hypothetical protein
METTVIDPDAVATITKLSGVDPERTTEICFKALIFFAMYDPPPDVRTTTPEVIWRTVKQWEDPKEQVAAMYILASAVEEVQSFKKFTRLPIIGEAIKMVQEFEPMLVSVMSLIRELGATTPEDALKKLQNIPGIKESIKKALNL